MSDKRIVKNDVQLTSAKKSTDCTRNFLQRTENTRGAESKGSSGFTIKKFLWTVGTILLATAATDAIPVGPKFSSRFGERSPAYPASSSSGHSDSQIWKDTSGKRTVQTSLQLNGKSWTADIKTTYPSGDPKPVTVLNFVTCTDASGTNCAVKDSTPSASFSGNDLISNTYYSACATADFGGNVKTPYHVCTPPIETGAVTKRDETSNPVVSSPECPAKATAVYTNSDIWTGLSGETVQTFLEVDCSGWTARMEVKNENPLQTSVTLMECNTDGSNCTPKHTTDTTDTTGGMLLGGYDSHVGVAYQACSTAVFVDSNVTDLCTPLIPLTDQPSATLNKRINYDEVD